jgi:hypothetical protein
MLRYLALSAAIVFGALLLILALPKPDTAPNGAPKYVAGHATPGPGEADRDPRTPEPMTGDAPWALSAVPECFRQNESDVGPPAFAHPHIPPGARPVPRTGTERLVTADCTLDVTGATAELRRGDTVLRIPAPSAFLVAGRVLVLDQREGSRERVRLYALSSGAAPAFVPLR